MWKAQVGLKSIISSKPETDDDWETDPNFVVCDYFINFIFANVC